MKQEDKQFLSKLAHELNTQDNCATRNPVWCIIDKHYVITAEGCGDTLRVAYDEHDYELHDFADTVIDDWNCKSDDEDFLANLYDKIVACTNTEELLDVLEENIVDFNRESSDLFMYEAKLEEYICRDTTGFLTKKSAEEHLAKNWYHYSPYARAYALSAWRNPVYERLINIIKETKWEDEK